MKLFRVTLLGLGLAVQGNACLWDRDTLAMEHARFPEAAEVIAGNFPRHSRAFYVWRKAQCEAALAKDPKQTALYDDLAVARHKLGDHRGAIETMQAKEKISPGLYETYSNLGTFYIYTGELDEALKWIDQALTINPNAHFGREKYQRWLVEWLKAGKPQTESPDPFGDLQIPAVGFAQLIVEHSGSKVWSEDLRQPALTGLLGMMRFADNDNPVLLEALGDVLSAGKFDQNASLLAAQAYVFASRKSPTDAEKQRLWKKMEKVGSTMDHFKPADVTHALDAALEQGAKLYAKVRADELAWIKAGKDAGVEFQKKYLIATN